MTWISDNKGAGPWDFIKQPDKPHYNEGNLISDHDNPVWATDHLSLFDKPVTPTHHPWCGYWHKDYTPPSPPPPPPPSVGYLYATGWNGSGQLGLGHKINKKEFTVVGSSLWKSTACGYNFTLAIKEDGTLWAAGNNTYGQLGLGYFGGADKVEFTLVSTDSWKSVTCGYGHSMAIKEDGSLWATGYNGTGGLGLGDSTNRNTFTSVGVSSLKCVTCGRVFTFILHQTGALYATGHNNLGQLGLGDTVTRYDFTLVAEPFWQDVAAGDYHTLALRGNNLHRTGDDSRCQLGREGTPGGYEVNFLLLDLGAPQDSVYCGRYSSFVREDEALKAAGYNQYGTLGVLGGGNYVCTFASTTPSSPFVSISGGDLHTFAIMANNILWATGENGVGELGLGDHVDRYQFTQIVSGIWATVSCGGSHTLAITLEE